MKLKTSTKILIAIFVIAVLVWAYPSFSNYWNEKHSTKAISTYIASLDKVDKEQYKQIWLDAIAYNQALLDRDNSFSLPDELRQRYEDELNISGDGVMGFIEIPKLDVSLPVYHGTEERVLQHAIGHIDWTSLPVGGESTHSVLSGHRGLPSARLFTDLDKLREGDDFTLSILDEVLTYEVDQIRTVEPRDTSDLLIEEGMDYCTLVTCTPYGINTHRLLIRGHRIETVNISNVKVVSEGVVIEPLVVAPIVAAPFLFILFMMVMLKKPQQDVTTDEVEQIAEKE